MMRIISPLALFCCLTVGSGCVTPNPLSAWRHSVERTIIEKGHGDPGVLRLQPVLLPVNDLRPAPVIVGALDLGTNGVGLGTRRDVQGILVDVLEHDSQVYFVFLVGVVRRDVPFGGGPGPSPSIEDIRLAAMRVHRRDFDWAVGPRDRQAIARYVGASPPSGTPASVDPRGVFHRPFDVLRAHLENEVVTVEEQVSQARWTVPLPNSKHGLSVVR